MNLDAYTEFLEAFRKSAEGDTLVKVSLSKPANRSSNLLNIYIKPVELKGEYQLQWVYHHKTKDETKIKSSEESLNSLAEMLPDDFLNAHLFSLEQDLQLAYSKKRIPKLLEFKPSFSQLPDKGHDRQKQRSIGSENKIYLHLLGITSAEGKVTKAGRDKYKQINRYVEVLDKLLRESKLPANAKVVDMGSGKGYLTFALYDHLTNNMGLSPEITGIELRPDLVEKCNAVAKQSGFDKLTFKEGSIDNTKLHKADIIIALHACDTATDDAIHQGIKADAKLIVCAPCCHKQVRKSMKAQTPLDSITRFGILEERQAEMLTDTIRALLLEHQGYKTNVFEFISLEHTGKKCNDYGPEERRKNKSTAVKVGRAQGTQAAVRLGISLS